MRHRSPAATVLVPDSMNKVNKQPLLRLGLPKLCGTHSCAADVAHQAQQGVMTRQSSRRAVTDLMHIGQSELEQLVHHNAAEV